MTKFNEPLPVGATISIENFHVPFTIEKVTERLQSTPLYKVRECNKKRGSFVTLVSSHTITKVISVPPRVS